MALYILRSYGTEWRLIKCLVPLISFGANVYGSLDHVLNNKFVFNKRRYERISKCSCKILNYVNAVKLYTTSRCMANKDVGELIELQKSVSDFLSKSSSKMNYIKKKE